MVMQRLSASKQEVIVSNGSVLVPARTEFFHMLGRFEGRKRRCGSFIAVLDSGHNRQVLSEAGWTIRNSEPEAARSTDNGAVDISALRPEQRAVYQKLVNLPAAALLCETGTGKTVISSKLAEGWIASRVVDRVLIIGSVLLAEQWNKEALPKWVGLELEKRFLAVNYSAFISKRLMTEILPWLGGHKYGVILDESQEIKNPNGRMYKQIREIMKGAARKLIMTGTITGTKNPVDVWAQYRLIDEAIIGCRYVSTFKNEYCVVGGFTGHQVVGAKNQERLKKLIEPYTGFLSRDDLNLSKEYNSVNFDLNEEQLSAIKKLKKTGELFGVYVPAPQLALKIQQISCGYFLNEEKAFCITPDDKNPRLIALKKVIREGCGRIIVWCAFQQDFEILRKAFPGALEVHGKINKKQKNEAIKNFSETESSLLLAHPRSAGAGLNLQVCNRAVYYSHSWKAIDRWQSEDRISRMGGQSVTFYWDIIANQGVDQKIKAAHREGKDYLGELTEVRENE